MGKTGKRMTGIKMAVSSSLYKKWLKDQRWNLLISACISVFLSILSYPGILYSDSYVRVSLADSLRMVIHAFFTGNGGQYSVESWLTVTPSFFILLSKEIVGSIVLYTFSQCFLFWLLTIVFADQISGKKHTWWNKLCIVLSPIIWAFGVYYEAGVGCVTAILAMLLLIWKWRSLKTRFDKVITVLLLVFSSFVCFGYRANALSIIPAVLVIIWLREKKAVVRSLLIGSVVLGFLGTIAIPKILSINTMSSYAAGFAWETVSTIQTMEPDKQEKYMDYLDDIFGSGATAEAVRISTYDRQSSSINSMFDSPLSIDNISKPGNGIKIIKHYFRLAASEPGSFFKMKWEMISHTLGIGKPIGMYEYVYNRWDRMESFRFNDSLSRKIYVNYFVSFMDIMSVLRRPWIMYLLCLILIVYWRFKVKGKRSEINLYEASYAVSLFYYGAFVLNTQSFEFRYYFPSWLLLFFICVGMTSRLLFDKERIRKLILIFFAVLTLVSYAGGYKMMTVSGDESVSYVETNGVLLYNENGIRVFYCENKLVFVSDKKSDTKYMYYLTVRTDDGEDVTYNFDYNSSALITSFYKEGVAVKELPDQKISSITFGQYYEDNSLWEGSANAGDFLSASAETGVPDTSDHT